MNIKGLLRDSVVYGVARYFGAFAAIFLTPIYTRILSKADYGVLDVFSIWSNLVVMVLPLGLIGALVRFYSDFSKVDSTKRKNLGSIFIGLIVLSIFYGIVMVGLKGPIIEGFLGGQLNDEVYYLSVLIVIGEIFKAYFMVQLQVRFEKYKYLVTSLLGLVLLVLLGFLFVYAYEMGIVGFFRASVLSLGITLVLLLAFLWKEVSLTFDWKVLKNLLSYSVHLLSASFLFLVTNLIDRYLILHYYSLEEIGIYAIGVKISSLVGLGTGAFTVAWFPIAMKIKDDDDASSIYKKVHNLYFLLALGALFVLFLFRKELILIFAPDYMESYRLISILSLFLIVHGAMFFYGLALHIKNKAKYLTISSVFSVVINLVVSVVLLNFIGLEGIAWGTLVGSFSWIAIQYYLCNRIYEIKFNYLLSLGVLLFLIVVDFMVEYYDMCTTELSIYSIAFKIVGSLLVLLGVYHIRINGSTLKKLIKTEFVS